MENTNRNDMDNREEIDIPLAVTQESSPLAYQQTATLDTELRLFIGHNADYYLSKWKKTSGNRASWNWAAFIGNIYWMGYRKMYLQVLILAVFYIIAERFLFHSPISATAALAVFCGFLGNTMYYNHAQKKITAIKSQQNDPSTLLNKIKDAGGTSWKGVAAAILPFLLYGLLIGSGTPSKAEIEAINLTEYFPTKHMSERSYNMYDKDGKVIMNSLEVTHAMNNGVAGKQFSVTKKVTITDNNPSLTPTSLLETVYSVSSNTIMQVQSYNTLLDRTDSTEHILLTTSESNWVSDQGENSKITGEITAVDQEVTTPAGTFKNCIEVTEELSDKDGKATVTKYYAPLFTYFLLFERLIISMLRFHDVPLTAPIPGIASNEAVTYVFTFNFTLFCNITVIIFHIKETVLIIAA